MSHFKKFLKHHKWFRVVLAILALWVIGSLAMWLAEPQSRGFRDLPGAFWNLTVYLTSGFEGEQPITPLGKVISVVVVVLGLALIGLFTASIASAFVEKALEERKGMRKVDMKGHIVICGWNEKAVKIIKELHSPTVGKRRQAIVVIRRENENTVVDKTDQAFEDVYFIIGEPNDEAALKRASVGQAYSAVVLADRARMDRSDAESILIALAIEAINPEVHTCVEVMDSTNMKHFRHTKVDECVSMDQLGDLLLSQVALNHGISEFFLELLTFQPGGNEVYHVPVPKAFEGRTFGELARAISPRSMIAVGLKKNGRVWANPDQDEELALKDRILIMARSFPELDDLVPGAECA